MLFSWTRPELGEFAVHSDGACKDLQGGVGGSDQVPYRRRRSDGQWGINVSLHFLYRAAGGGQRS